MAESVELTLGDGKSKLVAPVVKGQRCRGCKWQQVLGGQFGDAPMCVVGPLEVIIVPDVLATIPAGTMNHPIGQGLAGNFPTGGLQVVHTRTETRRPPAPDDYGCSKWTARLAL